MHSDQCLLFTRVHVAHVFTIYYLLIYQRRCINIRLTYVLYTYMYTQVGQVRGWMCCTAPLDTAGWARVRASAGEGIGSEPLDPACLPSQAHIKSIRAETETGGEGKGREREGRRGKGRGEERSGEQTTAEIGGHICPRCIGCGCVDIRLLRSPFLCIRACM